MNRSIRMLIVLTTRTCRRVLVVLLAVLMIRGLYGTVDRHVHSRRVEAMAGGLDGVVIAIDPGHGGRDPGAPGVELVEKEITLAIAGRVAQLVANAGGTAVLTREGDEDLSELMPENGTRKLREVEYRLKVARDNNADILVSIHGNATTSARWFGAQTFYDEDGGPAARRLAAVIQDELRRHTSTSRQPSSRINQYLLKHARIPAVTVEVGFLSNPREGRLLSTPEYQQTIAWAVFCGLVRYLAGDDT